MEVKVAAKSKLELECEKWKDKYMRLEGNLSDDDRKKN